MNMCLLTRIAKHKPSTEFIVVGIRANDELNRKFEAATRGHYDEVPHFYD